jgi:uncharacterized protein with FMN-binding domain
MKKILLSGFVVVTFIGYAIHQKMEGSQTVNLVTAKNTSATPTSDAATTMMGRNGNDSMGNGMVVKTYNDGVYTGDVADAFYGFVQVKITISSNKISDVEFLEYPNDRSTSVQISNFAMPRLRSEALSAQSASVNVVSGATQTSRAFMESLSSALAKAKS